ncbi:MAG: type I-E CRISPR-associated protein Cas5/CasD [Clostridia bacterium]|nr:type I-E CRISPR-associated protein Cas5/CasD [Clostridia bacterium]
MSTLLLRLAAPLQSWGGECKFNTRRTERIPTKSGVIGLVASALGRRRDESIADLASLRFGARIDKAGTLLRDYHIAQIANPPCVTNRYYLADALFLAGLEGDCELLRTVDAALASPAFPLYLGRRSCPPVGRLSLGIRDAGLEDALRLEPCLDNGSKESRLRIVVEAQDNYSGYFVRDVPLSFNQEHRQFGFRRVVEYTVENAAIKAQDLEALHEAQTEHDPMAELEV